MEHGARDRRLIAWVCGAGWGTLFTALVLAVPASTQAAPVHPPLPALSLDGSDKTVAPKEFNKACGAATDSKGDVYVASAGLSASPGSPTIDVFGPAHNHLTTIPNGNVPCSLAVDSEGNLYVSESATGNVVQYVPQVYPPEEGSEYEGPYPVDGSTEAKGIAVDPFDDRLYVAKGNHIDTYNPDGSFGIDEVQRVLPFNATGGTYRLATPGEGNGSRNEIQRIGRDAQAGGGTFTLEFDGQTTAPLPYNASAAEVQGALEALPNISPGDVSVSGFVSEFNPQYWWVEFTGALTKTDVPLIVGDGEGLSGFGNWSNEIAVQTLSDITAMIPYEASHAEVQVALEGLETIGPGDVSVTQGPNLTPIDHLVTFTGELADTDVPQLVGDATGLVGGGSRQILVFESVKGFSGHIGEGDLTEATGVASYTYAVEKASRYLFAADAATDQVKVFSGADIRELKLRKTIAGVDHDAEPETPDQSFGFGAKGAYLVADQGTCPPTEQACTAGHFFVYDDAHSAVEEFEASGEYLTRISHAEFADAEPTAIAVERSDGPNNGTLYVTSGATAAAKLLAFGPLPLPSRPPRPDLSLERATTCGVAVDRFGNRYVAAGSSIRVYDPAGGEVVVKGPKGEEPLASGNPCDLAIDSTGRLYALDRNAPSSGDEKAVYYTPTDFPPKAGTTYAGPTTVATAGPPYFASSGPLQSIGLNPGNDHVFVSQGGQTIELKSAKEGSGIFNPDLASNLGGSRGDVAAYGANGNVYLSQQFTLFVLDKGGNEILARIDGTGSPKGPFGQLAGDVPIAVDQSNGHLLIFKPNRGVAEEYEASGSFVAEFGSFENVFQGAGIAIDSSGGPSDGYAFVAYNGDLTAFEPLAYGEPPIAVTGLAAKVGGGKATLNGTVDPRRFAVEECRFEYLEDDKYQENVAEGKPSFEGADSVACAETPEDIGGGEGPIPVHAEIPGLDTEVRYRFRLIAQNKYGTSTGNLGLFGPPLLTARTAHEISYTEATLRATIDPSGLPTTYRFEYGTSDAYGQATDLATLQPNAGPTEIEVPLFKLQEGTPYHFRVLVANEAKTVPGPDQHFETLERDEAPTCSNAQFRTGRSAALPDCRAYELVTPADTRGLYPYQTPDSIDPEQFDSWLVDPRGDHAGESVAFSIYGTLPGFDGNGRVDSYRAERAQGEGLHPEGGWTSELFSPSYRQAGGFSPRQQGVASDQRYSFWRVDPGEIFGDTLAQGIYLRTPTVFEATGQGSFGVDLGAKGRFVTEGASHVIFESEEHLESEAAPVGTTALYDRTQAGTEVISIKPGGSPFGSGEDATYIAATEDGSVVVFEVDGTLYVRRGNTETVKVADGPNTFAGISEDGKWAFYADVDIPNTFVIPSELFAFELDSQAAVQIAEDAIFVHVSAGGSHVYFTSKDVLDDAEEGVVDADNLYVWDGTGIRFIAVLDSRDLIEFRGLPEVDLARWTDAIGPNNGRSVSPTRSTPDGEVLLFESHADLTPYGSEGHVQAYRYDAVEDSLLCVSCDPSGTPPSGDAVLQELASTRISAFVVTPNVTADGQTVFFASENSLLPGDANSVADVYEWRAKGAGGCGRALGCLALISSGQSEQPSYLYGMTPDGHDVFFTTLEKLVGADITGSPSIYDARVEGGIPDPPADESCQGDACQGPRSPSPPLPAPSSASSPPAVNSTPKRPCPKGKRRIVRRGVVRCVKKQAKKRRGAKVRKAGRARR